MDYLRTFRLLLIAVVFIVPQNLAVTVCPRNFTYTFYPSIDSPSSFIECSTDNEVTVQNNFTCRPGLMFNPSQSTERSERCKYRRSGYTFDCSNTPNGNGSYSGDPTLYATCVNNQATVLHQCPLGEYFITSQNKCDQSCDVLYKIGAFPKVGGYYTCTFNYSNYTWIITNYSSNSTEMYYSSDG